VADPTSHRVEKFDSAGHFILMLGKEVDRTTGGNVCTAASGDVCQAGVAGTVPGAFVFPTWVAVDNSGVLGQQGDVYVADRSSDLVTKFNSEGDVVSSWGNNGEGHSKNGPPNGQLNGLNATGAVAGPFGELNGIAVDFLGNLWVNAGTSDMFEFSPNSGYLTSWNGAPGSSEAGIAVDNEDNLYVGRADKFTSTGVELGKISQQGYINNFVVDPVSNNLYVATEKFRQGGAIYRYDSSCHPASGLNSNNGECTPAEIFGSNPVAPFGLAIDPSTPADTLYVTEEGGNEHPLTQVSALSVETVPDVVTDKATSLTSSSATLAGTVNPAGIELDTGLAGCHFEWGEHGVGETAPYGHDAPCDKTASQIGSGTSPVEVHAEISGLQQGKVYHFRLVAGNHNQVNEVANEPSLGSDLAFGPPSIESASVTSVGATSATVQAQVNPDNVDTRIRVEYGAEAGSYDNSTPELDLGPGGTGQLASIQLFGLSSHSIYHYRVVAENALGEGSAAIVSADHVFTTQEAAAGSVLPDARGWEMVSPPDKRGAQPFAINGGGAAIQASSTGDAMTYVVALPTEADPAANPNEVQVLSLRTADGWTSHDIATPHETATGVVPGDGSEYRVFSADLSLAVLHPFGNFDGQLSTEASEQTTYSRTNYQSGHVDSPCATSCYRPLITGAAGYENVPAGTEFAPTCSSKSVCGPEFVGASPDLGHIVLQSEVALVEGAPANALYEWYAGKLALVNSLPANGQGEELPTPAGQTLKLGSEVGDSALSRNTVSSDGARIIWSDETTSSLYMRDMAKGQTVQIGGHGAKFQTASSDGSKIIFTENEEDLRECEIVESEGDLHCSTSDLSPAAPGEKAGVLNTIPGASEDASYVYFVANGILQSSGAPVSGARPGLCNQFDSTGTCNLYVNHDGTIKLVAILSGGDNAYSGLTVLTARVSPDGDWLAFMSNRSLTGYDNRDSVSGKPDSEVYLYDAAAGGDTGRLLCASCNPTGARPHGTEYSRESIASRVPGWTPYTVSDTLYQSRYLSDSGRLFFDSYDALVPQDSNGTGDVYEYEPPGVGSCTTLSPGFAPDSDGCVALISSGTSKEESVFLDASEEGDNVFFLTAAQLSHTDVDDSQDIYDARVEGGFPEVSAPPSCEGDACQSPVSAPEDQTPGSLTYSGPGNPAPLGALTVVNTRKVGPLTRAQKLAKALVVCKRDKSKQARGRCERAARKRYGQVKPSKHKPKLRKG
jgi:hypothetical protein